MRLRQEASVGIKVRFLAPRLHWRLRGDHPPQWENHACQASEQTWVQSALRSTRGETTNKDTTRRTFDRDFPRIVLRAEGNRPGEWARD